MATIPITLWTEEIRTYHDEGLRYLIRIAKECGCDYGLDDTATQCIRCHGTGYAPCPYGEPGDVLLHMEPGYTYVPSREEWQHDETGRWATFPRLVREGEVNYGFLIDHEVETLSPGREIAGWLGEWDRNNPDHPWRSNPMVWVVKVK